MGREGDLEGHGDGKEYDKIYLNFKILLNSTE